MSKHINYGRPWWEVMKEVSEENTRLKAEVERLTTLVESNLNSSKVAMGKADAVLHERESLKAEVERLRKAGDRIKSLLSVSDIHYENARLQDEVERLIKAGDRMKGLLSVLDKHSPETRWDIVKAWNAAKEGKPSV